MRLEVLGFKQEELIKNGISLEEALILRDIEDFINSGKTTTYFCEEDGKMYHWILYEKILNDIPILGISKERLSRIINYNLSEKPKDYEEKYNNCSQATRKDMARRKYLGLLKGLVVKSVAEGTKSYFMFTDKFYDIREEIFSNTDTTFMSSASSQKSDIRHDKKVGRGSQKSDIRYDKKVRRGSDKKVVSDTTKKCYQTRQKSEPKDIYINIYIDIVEYLNEKTGKNYKHNSDKTRRFIDARLNEGFTFEDFKKVIDNKCQSWLNDERMNQYLRPETLFGTKFESYLNEIPISIKDVSEKIAEPISSGLSRFKEL